MAAVFLVYQPAWQGGFIWDDDQHVTRPELQSLQGLYHIWFDLGATLQYYPLTAQCLLARTQALGRCARWATTW